MLKLSCQADCSSKFKCMPIAVVFSGIPEFLMLLSLKVAFSVVREASRLANYRFQ